MKVAKVLIMGLPGAGKTTLARALESALREKQQLATIVDGDAVRAVYQDTDFSEAGRERQAWRMGDIADHLNSLGYTALCSFVCPTPQAREVFFESLNSNARPFVVFVDRVDESAYPDTNALFVPPREDNCDYIVRKNETVQESVAAIMAELALYSFQPTAPTALLVGRFQPFHDGHKALVARAIAENGQVVIGLRDTGVDADNPYTISERLDRIHEALDDDYSGRFAITVLPNVTKIVVGRKPGYTVEHYVMDADLEAISATEIRARERESGGEYQ